VQEPIAHVGAVGADVTSQKGRRAVARDVLEASSRHIRNDPRGKSPGLIASVPSPGPMLLQILLRAATTLSCVSSSTSRKYFTHNPVSGIIVLGNNA